MFSAPKRMVTNSFGHPGASFRATITCLLSSSRPEKETKNECTKKKEREPAPTGWRGIVVLPRWCGTRGVAAGTRENNWTPRFKKKASWCKKGEYSAQISPKSELCGFKWASTYNKCVHDFM